MVVKKIKTIGTQRKEDLPSRRRQDRHPEEEETCECVHAESLQSFLTLCNPITVTSQTPLSMGFSRQKYWNGLPFLSPGDLPNPALQADFIAEPPGKPKRKHSQL